MSNRDQHGNIVMAGRMLEADASKFSLEDCFNGWFMLQDITMREQGTVPGFVFLMDMKAASLAHITKISISALRKYYMYIQVWNNKYLARVSTKTPLALMVMIITNSKL
jgi:hypothetical protein